MSRLVKLTGEKMLTFSWIRTSTSELDMPLHLNFTLNTANATKPFSVLGWLGSRVVSVLDSGAEGPGFKSQQRHCPVTVLGKLFTPIVPLFTKQQNW